MDFKNNEIFLLKRLREGDEKAYIYLVNHYSKRLFGYAVSLTKNHTMAEDILQNIFLKCWEQRHKLHIKTSLQNYLYRSVYNEFINQYKKSKSTQVIEQTYFDTLYKITTDPNDHLMETQLLELKREIQNLPKKCRETFQLSRNEGLTNVEISNHLNVSIKTVEAHIAKAFHILRKKLSDKTKLLLLLLFDQQKFDRFITK